MEEETKPPVEMPGTGDVGAGIPVMSGAPQVVEVGGANMLDMILAIAAAVLTLSLLIFLLTMSVPE